MVAKRANVSIATVSHVINGTRYVSEETKAKVLKAMEELNYVPNSFAQGLRSKESKIIGLLIPIVEDETTNIFFMKMAQGIEKTLKKEGYNLIVSNTNENIEDEKAQIKIFNSRQIDGLIIVPTADDQSYMKDIVNDNYPVVFVDRRPKGLKKDYIISDSFQGSYDAVNLLIRKGHHKIGLISGKLIPYTQAHIRYEGYRKALEDANLPLDDSLVKVGNSKFEVGYQLTKELLNGQTDITALFVSSNIMAMGAMRFLIDNNIKIPDEIAVIAFDNYEWTKVTNPPLTVINQSSYELGVKAAEVILRKIKKPSQSYREYKLPTKLIIRNSC